VFVFRMFQSNALSRLHTYDLMEKDWDWQDGFIFGEVLFLSCHLGN
jgi:hypothetical protein